MLKENKIGKIVSFKTTSGDEVVGRVMGHTADDISISQPVILAASQQGLAMVPFLMTADPKLDVSFKLSMIVCMADTTDQVADAYTENSTGIRPVRNSGLIMS